MNRRIYGGRSDPPTKHHVTEARLELLESRHVLDDLVSMITERSL